MLIKKEYLYILFIFLLLTTKLLSQNIWENQSSEVYPFLNRMSQKGLIEFKNLIQPIGRNEIKKLLNDIDSTKIYKLEKEELNFYLEEYNENLKQNNKNLILKRSNNRWRTVNIINNEFSLKFDPIVGFNYNKTNERLSKQYSNGFDIWGSLGKKSNLSFQVYYRDYSNNGDLYLKNIESKEKGEIYVGILNDKQNNFSELKTSIKYTWDKGSISVGQDNFTWGYGESGQIILSDITPSYPYIKLELSPVKWLKFDYSNFWLNSNIVDSNQSYKINSDGVSNDFRSIYVKKFMASHSISFFPNKGLSISLGESIIYSDEIDIGFLVPINLFKIYDNNRSNYSINAGSNGQIFFQLNSRNQIKNTNIYASAFIDEIRISKIFNKEQKRNQLGFNIGASKTDFLINYLTIGYEYTRVNPFVYKNLLPTQDYSSYNFNLGDWMGNNFDRSTIYLKFNPIPRLRLNLLYNYIKKGGSGSISEQYTATPQPVLFFDYKKTRKEILFNISYEIIHNLYFKTILNFINEKYVNNSNLKINEFSTGISFGL